MSTSEERNAAYEALKAIIDTDAFREALETHGMSATMLFYEHNPGDSAYPLVYSTVPPDRTLMVLSRGIERIARDWPPDLDSVLGKMDISVVGGVEAQQILQQILGAETGPQTFEEMKSDQYESERADGDAGGEGPGGGSNS